MVWYGCFKSSEGQAKLTLTIATSNMKEMILRITYCKRSWARRQAKLLEKATQREKERADDYKLLLLLRDQFEQRKLIFAKTRNINLFAQENRKESAEKKQKNIKQKLDPQYLMCFWLFLIILVVFFFLMFALFCFFSVCKTLHSPCYSAWESVGSKFPRRMSPAFWQTRGTYSMNAASSAGNVPKPWTPTSLGLFKMFPAVIEYVE